MVAAEIVMWCRSFVNGSTSLGILCMTEAFKIWPLCSVQASRFKSGETLSNLVSRVWLDLGWCSQCEWRLVFWLTQIDVLWRRVAVLLMWMQPYWLYDLIHLSDCWSANHTQGPSVSLQYLCTLFIVHTLHVSTLSLGVTLHPLYLYIQLQLYLHPDHIYHICIFIVILLPHVAAK